MTVQFRPRVGPFVWVPAPSQSHPWLRLLWALFMVSVVLPVWIMVQIVELFVLVFVKLAEALQRQAEKGK